MSIIKFKSLRGRAETGDHTSFSVTIFMAFEPPLIKLQNQQNVYISLDVACDLYQRFSERRRKNYLDYFAQYIRKVVSYSRITNFSCAGFPSVLSPIESSVLALRQSQYQNYL